MNVSTETLGESWKDIKGYEGFYKVSDQGRVKSIERYIDVFKSDGTVGQRRVRERILKEKYDLQGVCRVGLSQSGEVTDFAVHDLVFKTFIGEGLFLEHIDFDKGNNKLSNLRGVDSHVCSFSNLKGKLTERDLTQDLVKECFEYKDGSLIWKLRPPSHFESLSSYRCFRTDSYGKIAGYYNKRVDSNRDDFGYWRVGFTLGKSFGHFKLHRLIYLWHHGYIPLVVDHEDCDQNNNRIENLRGASKQTNSFNLRTNYNSKTGYKGVSEQKDPKRRLAPFRAAIEWNGYSFGLGSYKCKHRAARAYNIASDLLFQEFSNLNETPCTDTIETFTGKFFKKDYFKIKEGTFDWGTKTKRKPKRKTGDSI